MRILILLILFTSFVFTGCSIFTSDKKAEVKFTAQRALLNEGTFHLSFTDGDKSVELSNQDFEGKNLGASSPSIETATSGQLLIEFKFKDSQTNQLISKGSFQLELKEDWRYGISFRSDSAEADPTFGCFGCIGYRSFKINQEPLDSTSSLLNDSLYVIWSGNYISNPVIY
ncbi:MAG TPA: hypothetical protein VF181_13000 [Balneolaceae bacterium]